MCYDIINVHRQSLRLKDELEGSTFFTHLGHHDMRILDIKGQQARKPGAA